MASSAIEGFVTGFANTLAIGITERKKEARDFFNKQVEYARTTGLENRQRVRQTVDASLSIAQQLEAAGVPREIIMAQINMNPAGLADFYTTAEKIRAEKEATYKRPLTADEWKSIFKVSGDFRAPDEDLSTFISRTYDPISNAVRSPTFEDDPEGSLISSMMGYTAMDEARRELGRTVIAEGLTAEQLVNMGDAQPQRIGGNATVAIDYTQLTEDKPLDLREVQFIDTVIEEELNTELDSAVQAGTLVLADGADATSVRDTVISNVSATYPNVPVVEIERLVDARLRRQGFTISGTAPADTATEDATGGAETTVEAPQVDQMGEGSATVQTPATTAPTVSVDTLSPEERMAAEVAFGYQSVVDNSDGTVTVTLSDGSVKRYKASDVRALLRRYMTE
jgi:hypothetical protein